ncbi:tyrosine-protein phosphatase [Labrys sp. KB_33_2]|uniref:tyrosine-protein phosphatase n=1 Tax=Labrys sp. KB_33_2 TaxID=3237479 RepID=UPI003F928E27
MPPLFMIIRDIIRDIFRNIDNIISFILINLMIIAAIFASIYEKISTDRSIALASLSILFALLLSYYRLKQHVRYNPGSSLRHLLPRVLLARSKGGSRACGWLSRTLFWSISAVAIYVVVLICWGNFGTVIRGQVYRSAQLGSATMSFNVQRYGIKAIINLRGSNPGQDWYDREVADAKVLGIHHIDFRMSAKRGLSREQAEELIALMAQAPKPLLIHCASGADRTGLAAALYVAAIAKAGREKAQAQLSPFFGHLSLPFLPGYAMDRTWEEFAQWLNKVGHEPHPALARSDGNTTDLQ